MSGSVFGLGLDESLVFGGGILARLGDFFGRGLALAGGGEFGEEAIMDGAFFALFERFGEEKAEAPVVAPGEFIDGVGWGVEFGGVIPAFADGESIADPLEFFADDLSFAFGEIWIPEVRGIFGSGLDGRGGTEVDARVLEIAPEIEVSGGFEGELGIDLGGVSLRARDGELAGFGEEEIVAVGVFGGPFPGDGGDDGGGVFASFEFVEFGDGHGAPVIEVPEIESAEIGADLIPADEDPSVVGIGLFGIPGVKIVAFFALEGEVGFDLSIAVDQFGADHAVFEEIDAATWAVGTGLILESPISEGERRGGEKGEGSEANLHGVRV